jgi:hypothetical protein
MDGTKFYSLLSWRSYARSSYSAKPIHANQNRIVIWVPEGFNKSNDVRGVMFLRGGLIEGLQPRYEPASPLTLYNLSHSYVYSAAVSVQLIRAYDAWSWPSELRPEAPWTDPLLSSSSQISCQKRTLPDPLGRSDVRPMELEPISN